MIDLRLFTNRLFSINLVTGFLTFMASAGTTILMPYYLQNVMGYTPQKTGLLMAVVPIALGIISPISGSLSDRFGTRPLTVIGLAFMLLGYILVSTLQTDTSALGYILRFLPIGIGAGIFQSPNNSEIMSSAPRESLGVASGLLSLTRTLGQTTGIAILGAIWTGFVFSQYSAEVLDATAAPGVSSGVCAAIYAASGGEWDSGCVDFEHPGVTDEEELGLVEEGVCRGGLPVPKIRGRVTRPIWVQSFGRDKSRPYSRSLFNLIPDRMILDRDLLEGILHRLL